MHSLIEHTETEIATRFGSFNVRVYGQGEGKETVVLWTEGVELVSFPLVRVHSECLTGDVFGSSHCDCGKQLEKALKKIQEFGGVLIYLRQEGRGIGLFEKIKTYNLQKQGYDTFEANRLLGHPPDNREYSFVKRVLDDLCISSIVLMTNNPSKVSEISKLGIDIVDTAPVISRPNLHNKKYIETKKMKFQHYTSNNRYSFQFPVDSNISIEQLASFVKPLIKDPLLDIFVNVTSHVNDLKKNSLQKTAQHCLDHGFVPILHLSFRECKQFALEELADLSSWFTTIQINDLDPFSIKFIEQFLLRFKVILPLSESTFENIHNKKLQRHIKKGSISVSLDNSGGQGKKESLEWYKQKIDQLLEYGINRVTLCGGFGPDALETYFALRRFYKINFSIDAESGLKTGGYTDQEKIKRYLKQLIFFNDPKQQQIEQTKKLLEQSQQQETDANILGHSFKVLERVFHPGIFPSTEWFASQLINRVSPDTKFCEVGCGCGAVSCLVGLHNPNVEITCTDINPQACHNTRINASRSKVNVDIYETNVLDGVKRRFDMIFWALPFGFLDPGASVSLVEMQVFDPGYCAIRKFIATGRKHLLPGGRLLIGFSNHLGHAEMLNKIANEHLLTYEVVASTMLRETEEVDFLLIEGRYRD